MVAVTNDLSPSELDSVRQTYLQAQQKSSEAIYELQERLLRMEDTLNRAGQPVQAGEQRQRFLKAVRKTPSYNQLRFLMEVNTAIPLRAVHPAESVISKFSELETREHLEASNEAPIIIMQALLDDNLAQMDKQAKYIAKLKTELAVSNGGQMQPVRKQQLHALNVKEQALKPKYTGPSCQVPGRKSVTSHRTQDCRSMLKCDRCDRTGHTADRCNTIGLTCLLCNSADHLIAKCPRKTPHVEEKTMDRFDADPFADCLDEDDDYIR